MITIVPYNTQWPIAFAEEANLVSVALGSNCIAIHHIGSTAVPGLKSKPIIDILAEVRELHRIDQATGSMKTLGYRVRKESGFPARRLFQKGQDTKTHNLHIYQEGNPEIEKCLKFRDWMRTHPKDATMYAQLKEALAIYSKDIVEYCNGKATFIASILAKSDLPT